MSVTTSTAQITAPIVKQNMRIFVTGATGFIGSALVPELIRAGHRVLGLARSEAGAKGLIAAGAEVLRGSLEDLEGLKKGAAECDGVVHLAFNHDFSKFVANCEADRQVIEAIGSVLIGSNRPFIVTSGTAIANMVPGQPALEGNSAAPSSVIPRAASEEVVQSLVKRGVNASIVRLPQVHDPVKQGLITFAVAVAVAKGVSAYIGDGSNRWPAAHISDTARLYRLALEKAAPGAIYHAVAEEGVSLREIAEVIGRGLKVPVVSLTPEAAAEHFGWLAMFAARDMPASSAQTRERLGWEPTGPTMMADLELLRFTEALGAPKYS